MPGPNTRYDCVVHSIRKRLADPDGISVKAALDGIVKAQVLIDDSAKYIRQVVFSQQKCELDDEEKTVITFYER